MKIKLSEIKPSSKPIRTSWDEDKMNELAQSIKEQGLIVPVKVRPQNGRYELVYGHRRVEAARRAGLTEVETIVEGMDDPDAIIQALIENVQREDMTSLDKAKALKLIKELTSWSNHEIERRGIYNRGYVIQLLQLLHEPEDVQEMIGGFTETPTTEGHIRYIRRTGIRNEDKKPILEKAAKEGLTQEQTGKIAETIAATKDPKMREKLIKAPYSPYTHDPEYAKERAERYGAHDPAALDKTAPPDEVWRLTVEVSMLLNFIKKSREMYEEAVKMDEIGKFAPEARPFIAQKLRRLVSDYQKLIERLES
jgi:ParB family chromosome partitioning protein